MVGGTIYTHKYDNWVKQQTTIPRKYHFSLQHMRHLRMHTRYPYLQRDHPDTFSRPTQKHLRLFLASRRPPASRISRLPRHLPFLFPPPAGPAVCSGEACHAVELCGKLCFGFGELQARGPGFLLPFQDGACPVASEQDGEGACFPVKFSSAPRCLLCVLTANGHAHGILSESASILTPLCPAADGRSVFDVYLFLPIRILQQYGREVLKKTQKKLLESGS